jgi:hypothetical protein
MLQVKEPHRQDLGKTAKQFLKLSVHDDAREKGGYAKS